MGRLTGSRAALDGGLPTLRSELPADGAGVELDEPAGRRLPRLRLEAARARAAIGARVNHCRYRLEVRDEGGVLLGGRDLGTWEDGKKLALRETVELRVDVPATLTAEVDPSRVARWLGRKPKTIAVPTGAVLRVPMRFVLDLTRDPT